MTTVTEIAKPAEATSRQTADAASARPGSGLAGVPKRRRGRSVFWKQRIMGYAFLAPTLILFFVFTVLPILMSFFLSLTDYNLVYIWKMVGFRNFIDAFKKVEFLRSFLNVFVYALMVIPMSIVTALLAAVLVNTKTRGTKVFRVLYYLPAVTSGIAISYMWKWMFNESDGLFNAVLTLLHLPTSKWVASPSYMSMFSISLVSVWSSLGGNMIIFLAALKGVSPELYEAAEVDGASAFRRLWSITLPSIAPTMYFIVTMSIINAFQLFDTVFVMVPQTKALLFAQTPVLLIYEEGFHQFKGGYGTAMSIILFAVIMIVTFATQAFMKEDKTV